MTGQYIQIIAALAALASMVGIFTYLARKKQQNSSLMSIVAYQSVGQKNAVAALRVGGEVLILGVTPSEFKVLKTLKEEDAGDCGVRDIRDKVEKLRKLKEGIGARDI